MELPPHDATACRPLPLRSGRDPPDVARPLGAINVFERVLAGFELGSDSRRAARVWQSAVAVG